MQLLMFTLCVSWFLLNSCCSATQNSQTSQIKRKRLNEHYSIENVKIRDCRQSLGTQCEVCFAPGSAAKYIKSANDPKEKLRICKKCFTNSKLPQPEERILISCPEDKFSVAKILKINENNTYDIQFIEGQNAGNYDTIDKSGFTKLVHEIIPIEKLCPICNYFIFGEQKCERKNCEKGICYSCYQKVPQCEFCKLLHRGTPVVVKQKNLSKFTEIILEHNFGQKFTEVYGYIIHNWPYTFCGKKTICYEVALSNDYEWEKEENSQIWLTLNTNKPLMTYLLENEVEVLKPPNTYQENNENEDELFDYNQFYNDQLSTIGEVEEHEEEDDDEPQGNIQFYGNDVQHDDVVSYELNTIDEVEQQEEEDNEAQVNIQLNENDVQDYLDVVICPDVRAPPLWLSNLWTVDVQDNDVLI